jgi:hypothetical protein
MLELAYLLILDVVTARRKCTHSGGGPRIEPCCPTQRNYYLRADGQRRWKQPYRMWNKQTLKTTRIKASLFGSSGFRK